MEQDTHPVGEGKLSRELRSRLEQLESGETVRAVVLLDVGTEGPRSGHRQSAEERRAAIQRVRQSAQAAVSAIDTALEACAGRRLSPEANALGSITVEATPQGLEALAQLPSVRAVLEDQPISLLAGGKR